MANSGQRCRWLCAGGANGGLFAAVLHGALDLEFADMKTHFEMAKEAGLRDSVNLERFAELVRADEREACAKVCDSYYESWINIHGRYEFMGEGAQECATAIRAKGNT